ncbi:BlaI/MecI/CopY family transcriptional regulator [Lapillicoccus sp.]|uniref:BlaI/MecI/CopY family transcriptional regulator n=1 Tax=Lapillicoccus sp. TaxID=1909287 RepID=UPI003983129A
MPGPRPRSLGDLERGVMDHLWSLGDGAAGVTVREVHGVLGTERVLAYTTLMTVLDRLARKRVVERVREGRAWSHTVAASRGQLTAERMRRTLDDLGSSDRRSALLHFLNDSSPTQLTELRSALDELEERHRADRG